MKQRNGDLLTNVQLAQKSKVNTLGPERLADVAGSGKRVTGTSSGGQKELGVPKGAGLADKKSSESGRRKVVELCPKRSSPRVHNRVAKSTPSTRRLPPRVNTPRPRNPPDRCGHSQR